jgi:hypothetical protein
MPGNRARPVRREATRKRTSPPLAPRRVVDPTRHLVGDRLDITGARWGLHGAEAVLKLRALWTNGDFPAYWQFHLRQEHRRVHQARYQHPPARAA